jgi:hypothetical protein
MVIVLTVLAVLLLVTLVVLLILARQNGDLRRQPNDLLSHADDREKSAVAKSRYPCRED